MPLITTRSNASARGYGAFLAAAASSTSFESIATATASGSQSTITFYSIPSTYQHLQIRILAWGGSNMLLRLNNDSGATQYRGHGLIGQGGTVYAEAPGASSSIKCHYQTSLGAGNNYPSATIIDIHDYVSTSKYKTFRFFFGKEDNGSYNGSVEFNSGLWLSTSAVDRVDLINNGGSFFASGSHFALYGIKGAA